MEKRKSTRLTPSRTKKQLQPQNATVSLVSKAGVNETCFRILITGPQDILPTLAKQMKNCIFDKHNVKNLKIHYAVSLNEEIALKLKEVGLHAVVVCTDSSKSETISQVQETFKHLHFNLISTSVFFLNVVHPLPAIFLSVSDAIEKLRKVFSIQTIHMIFEDEKSIISGVERVSTAALQAAKFIYGHVPPLVYRIEDFTQLSKSSA